MFWDLNGTTLMPLLARILQSAATTVLFPAWEEVPSTMMDIYVKSA
jgi:hypothetical protein